MKLSLIEALCISKCGWTGEHEKELFEKASKIVQNVSSKCHLKYQLSKLEGIDVEVVNDKPKPPKSQKINEN